MNENKQALLVIDVQNEYFTGRLPVTYPADSFANLLRAMDHAAVVGMPVAVIQHTAPSPDSPTFRKGSKEWRLHAEVEKRKYDILIEKALPGSFTGTELEGWLEQKEIVSIAICGFMTQMCCDTTARQAFHRGFQVDFLADATGTLSTQNGAGFISDRDLHQAILVTQAMRFSRVIKADEWIASINDSKNEQERRKSLKLDEIELREGCADHASLAKLYRAAGLGDRSAAEIRTVFEDSRYTVSAFCEGKLLGAARAYGDEFDCCVICDLAVFPEHQGNGIGRLLMNKLLDLVKHHRRIILYAMPGKEGFYQALGFHKMKTAMMTSSILDQELARRIGFIE